jgi:diguanylate cyclase (GGDEF)-like protein
MEALTVSRMSNTTSLRTRLLALSCAAGGLGAASAFCFGAAHSGVTPSIAYDLLGAALLGGAGASFIATMRVAASIVRSLQTVRSQVAAVIAGELSDEMPGKAPKGELGELQALLANMVRTLKASRQSLAERTKTVDRLLEFSQTIQGAGRVDQIFPTLCHFLESELGLSGATILAYESDPTPCVSIKASCPAGVINDCATELDAALCPCLRQSQPRLFRTGDSPVRCTIDQYLTQPLTHEAYCIPFNVGPKKQFVLHMLLPEGQTWTEQRRQLAQTYANSAQSSLTSLHLLAEAEKQSMTDALTGLFNRRSLDQLLQREVALSERHKQPLSLVMIDMDFFKQINDAHGHAAGDHLLRAFADCVRMTLRKTDLAFRYGGDEFVIALPQTPVAQAQQVVQKLRQAFASVDFTSAIAHLEKQPTLSIGVAERSAGTNLLTLPALLGAVDQALYEAKAVSRNCVRTYQPPKAA